METELGEGNIYICFCVAKFKRNTLKSLIYGIWQEVIKEIGKIPLVYSLMWKKKKLEYGKVKYDNIFIHEEKYSFFKSFVAVNWEREKETSSKGTNNLFSSACYQITPCERVWWLDIYGYRHGVMTDEWLFTNCVIPKTYLISFAMP